MLAFIIKDIEKFSAESGLEEPETHQKLAWIQG